MVNMTRWLRMLWSLAALHVVTVLSNTLSEDLGGQEFVQCRYTSYECQILDRSTAEWAINCYDGGSGIRSCSRCKDSLDSNFCKGYCPEFVSRCGATTTILPAKVEFLATTTTTTTTTTTASPDSVKVKPRKWHHKKQSKIGINIYKPLFVASLLINVVLVAGVFLATCHPGCRNALINCLPGYTCTTSVKPDGLSFNGGSASPKPANGDVFSNQMHLECSLTNHNSREMRGGANNVIAPYSTNKDDAPMHIDGRPDDTAESDCESSVLLAGQDLSTVNSSADLLR